MISKKLKSNNPELPAHIANIYKILNDENARYKDAKDIAKKIKQFIKDNNHDPYEIFKWFCCEPEDEQSPPPPDKNNNPEYYFLIGFLWEWGIGIESSMKDSFYWYQLAAESTKDDPVVHNQGKKNLANCYANGLGVARDLQKALQLYQESAQAAYYESALILAQYLKSDAESQENQEKSFNWIRIAAYDSYPPAQTELGLHHLNSSKAESAKEWFKLAAENGEPRGQIQYAHFTRDSTEKFTYFKKAAEAGDIEGLYRLGDCYLMGIGTRIDWNKATRCFLKVAEKNGNDFDTYTLLACHFSLGIGCSKDMHQTMRYYKCKI
ncbi:10193_t:CDS:2 [Ambispora leptoticha]|uniref:10193_t:CDS:1 n=1 Tax=Ambispora leptoticha TaxID=144679 RepID=A0A9N9CCI8_9GLOM|nr:10193_t:CDS:2 [Ambispora leptoticha]